MGRATFWAILLTNSSGHPANNPHSLRIAMMMPKEGNGDFFGEEKEATH
jgi:hypothetical protein